MGDNGWTRPGTDARRENGMRLGSVRDGVYQSPVPNGGGAQYKTFAGGMSNYAMPMYRNGGGYVGQHGFPVPPYSGAVPSMGLQAFSAATAHMAGVNPLQHPGGGVYGAPRSGMHAAGMVGSPALGYSPPYLQQWINSGVERNGTQIDPNNMNYNVYNNVAARKERDETWSEVNPMISLEDTEMNMNTAYACDFVIDQEGPEERGILPPDADKNMYAVVRNIILNAWRSNVSTYLSEKQAVSLFPDVRKKPYAVAAWRFLNSLGYINFGVADELQKRVRDGPEDRGSVVVIGAGCAGIAAARQLRMKGYKVVILEGRDRPGGRVHTEGMYGPMGDDPTDAKPMALADLGGSILTGIDGNPLAVIAKQMKIPLSMIKSDNVPIYLPDGQVADKEIDTMVEKLYNGILHDSDGLRQTAPNQSHVLSLEDALESLWKIHEPSLNLTTEEEKRTARMLFDWHLANLEFANASLLRESSLLHWDQDDPHELPGPHCFAPGMNGRWIKRLIEDIPIFYDSVVSKIKRHSDGVKIYTESKKVFLADAVVVTSPLGVLKRGKIQFDPPLSNRKTGAIHRLGFGNLNKVIMLFHKAFWDTDYDIFGHANEDQDLRGDSFMFYSYAGISGGAQLTALCSGEAAQKLEDRSPEECANRVLDVLRKIYEPKGIEVPPPLHVICTRWGSDPMAYGAYSSMPVGSEGGVDYDILGENIHGRIYFAGEATNRKFPATMHGAFYTGLWTAANIDATFKKMRLGGSKYSKKHALMEQADDQSRRVSPKLSVSVADRLLLQNARLNLVFNDPDYPPPLIFCDSSFKCIPGKDGTRFKNQTLLCIDPIMLRGKQDAIHLVVPTVFVETIMVKPIYEALEMIHDKYFKGKRKGPTEEDMKLVDDFVDEVLRERRSNGRKVNQEFLVRKMHDLFQT